MRIGRLSHARWFRRGRPNRQAGRPPYPRESATLQRTLPNCKADAYPGEAHTGPRPATGRDSLLLGAGFTVQWNDRFATYAFYDGELARTNYRSNSVSVGFRYQF